MRTPLFLRWFLSTPYTIKEDFRVPLYSCDNFQILFYSQIDFLVFIPTIPSEDIVWYFMKKPQRKKFIFLPHKILLICHQAGDHSLRLAGNLSWWISWIPSPSLERICKLFDFLQTNIKTHYEFVRVKTNWEIITLEFT